MKHSTFPPSYQDKREKIENHQKKRGILTYEYDTILTLVYHKLHHFVNIKYHYFD